MARLSLERPQKHSQQLSEDTHSGVSNLTLVDAYPGILANSSSACSLNVAILLHGFNLSVSLLAEESDLYTMPVLSSMKTFTPRFAASLPTARDNPNDRNLYTSSSCE